MLYLLELEAKGPRMFEELRKQIATRIANLPNGSHFNLRDLLDEMWPEDSGEAKQLGRSFRRSLADFPGVEDAGKDDENLRWYFKQ